MKYNKEEEQLFFELVYLLQNNESKAINAPKEVMAQLFPNKVYRKQGFYGGKFIYSLEPIPEFNRYDEYMAQVNDAAKESRKMRSPGRKPISESEIADIQELHSRGRTIGEIAVVVNRSKGTVHKYLKEMKF